MKIIPSTVEIRHPQRNHGKKSGIKLDIWGHTMGVLYIRGIGLSPYITNKTIGI